VSYYEQIKKIGLFGSYVKNQQQKDINLQTVVGKMREEKYINSHVLELLNMLEALQ